MTNAELERITQQVRDPETSPERLVELLVADGGDVVVDAFLQNPGLSLLLLEAPDFWSQVDEDVQQCLMDSPRCPSAFAEWMLLHPDFHPEAFDLALNAALPRELRRRCFQRWIQVAHWSPHRARLVDVLSPEERQTLERAGADGPAAATLTDAEFEQLEGLGALGRWLALSHPGCPTAVLTRLLGDAPERFPDRIPRKLPMHSNLSPLHREAFLMGSLAMQEAAVKNPGLTREQLEGALRNPHLRHHVAANVALPADLQAALALDEGTTVRMALLCNPGVTAEARRLALSVK